jgi:peptidoglycan hydrolase CwlO-like protein
MALPAGNVHATTSSSPSPSPSSSPPTTSQPEVQKLEAQIAALQGQLTTALEQQQGASQSIVQVQQQLTQTQAQLATDQITLDQINQKLAITNAEAAAAQAKVDQARKELSALIRYQYETNSNGSAGLNEVLSSQSFTQAVASMDNIQVLVTGMQTLTTSVAENLAKIRTLQASEVTEQQQAQAVVSQLTQLSTQEQAEQAAYNQQVATLSGSAIVLNTQIEQLVGQILGILGTQEGEAALASAVATGQTKILGGGLPPFAFGPLSDDFPWGQCTWYVASLRVVTWSGNAWQWAANAAAQGLPEGPLPQVGAIVVWGPGNGYSDVGHVAYVSAVQSPSSFTVSEGNYEGLGIVDSRQINTLSDVETFIYGA